MDITHSSVVIYALLQVCAFVGIVSRALPGKEDQTASYQATGNLVPILGLSFAGYVVFLFG
jgi:hypothetical protein